MAQVMTIALIHARMNIPHESNQSFMLYCIPLFLGCTGVMPTLQEVFI